MCVYVTDMYTSVFKYGTLMKLSKTVPDLSTSSVFHRELIYTSYYVHRTQVGIIYFQVWNMLKLHIGINKNYGI